MPISLDKGLIFVRVPNETELSVAEALGLDDFSPHGVGYYLDKYPGSFTKTKKMCVVRNPWDRFAYFFECVKESSNFHDHNLLADMSFSEFVEDFKANRDKYKNPCWLPQTSWIWSQYGPIINHVFVEDPEYLEAPQLTSLHDQIKTVAELDLDVDEIDREAALARRAEFYTPELVQAVSELYSHDIQAFSYVYDSGLAENDLNILDSSEEDLNTSE